MQLSLSACKISTSFSCIFTKRLDDVSFDQITIRLCQIIPGTHKFRSIQQGIVFMCVKLSEISILYVFHYEPKATFIFAAYLKL